MFALKKREYLLNTNPAIIQSNRVNHNEVTWSHMFCSLCLPFRVKVSYYIFCCLEVLNYLDLLYDKY